MKLSFHGLWYLEHDSDQIEFYLAFFRLLSRRLESMLSVEYSYFAHLKWMGARIERVLEAIGADERDRRATFCRSWARGPT